MAAGKQPRSFTETTPLAQLDLMEPDLRLLEGIVALLRALSETSDAIEPVALEAMAHLSSETVERITINWRQAIAALRLR